MFIKYENGIYNLEKVGNITYNVNESQNTEIKLR